MVVDLMRIRPTLSRVSPPTLYCRRSAQLSHVSSPLYCLRCTGGSIDCFLHLRGMSTWDSLASSYPAVYSNPSAPGFIMATGVVSPMGLGLEDDPEG